MSVWSSIPDKRRRQIAFTGLIVGFISTGAVFVPMVTAYVSTEKIQTAEMSITNLEIEDNETLVLTVRFENPTRQPIQLVGVRAFARVEGILVNDPPPTRLVDGNVRIGPEDTRTFTLRAPLLSEKSTVAETGVQAGTMEISGQFTVQIREETVIVRFNTDR